MLYNKNKMFVTDYDGTLADNRGKVSLESIEEFVKIGDKGVIRVVATGRSFFSFESAVGSDFPLDYLICSSGIGIYDWKKKELLYSKDLDYIQTKEIYNYLIGHNYDFMVQLPIPNNHFFHHFSSGKQVNNDFQQRIDNYEQNGLEEIKECPEKASQFVIICPDEAKNYNIISTKFRNLNVIKATSPLDGKSIWIEILPCETSKASGIKFLQKELNIELNNIVSVGNDYYDLEMLNYTKNSYVVANSPDELKSKFKIINSNVNNGVVNLLKKLY